MTAQTDARVALWTTGHGDQAEVKDLEVTRLLAEHFAVAPEDTSHPVTPRRPSRSWVALGMLSCALAVMITMAMAGRLEVDFDVYRLGGIHVFGPDLYSAHLPHPFRPLLFTYPPFAAFMFWPFGHLSLHAGQLTWSALNCVALLALVLVSIKVTRALSLSRQVVCCALVFMLPALMLEPVLLTMQYGQINVFIVLMVLADLTCVVGFRNHNLPRGTLVGVAAAIKLTPFIFVPFLFLTRQFRAGFTALTSFCFWTLGAFALAPHSSSLYWTKEVFATGRVGTAWFVSNQNIQGAWDRLAGSTPSPLLVLVVTVLVAVAGLALAARAYRRSSHVLGVLLCATTGLIVSPISWSHHYVWIVPVLAWLIFAADRPRGGRWWALGAAILFVRAPQFRVPLVLHHYSGIVQYAEGNAFFLAAVVFLVLSALMLWRRDRTGGELPSDPRSELVRNEKVRSIGDQG
jgi:alpha-1,2-mannosyltransferase